MNIEIASFILGGILLFVGVLGGGFEVKEVKIPKVGAGVRILAGIVGLLFICLGMGLENQPSPQPNPPAVVHADNLLPPQPPSAQPVDFTLTDELGDGEVSEQVTLLIDGKNVGDITVNQDYPNSKMTITVPTPGNHSYTAEGTAVVNDQGTLTRLPFAGQGMIDVKADKTYSLRGSITGNTWLVTIVQEQ